jgi:hypothetical protein
VRNEQSLAHRNCRSLFPSCARRGLRLERFSRAPGKAIRLEHFGNYSDFYDQHFRSRLRRVFRRALAEPQRTAHRSLDRWRALRLGSFSRQLLAQSLVVVSELRRDRRNRSRSWIHRSRGGVGEMVPGSKRTHYRHRGWRIRSGRTYNRSGGDETDSERWCFDHICLARHRLSGRYSYFRRFHAESA